MYADWIEVPVRWSDMDANGQVNSANFFIFFELGRIHLYEQVVNGDWQQTSDGPVIVSVACDFVAPLRFPAVLDVGTAVTRIGESSFTLEHGLYIQNSSIMAARGRSVVVWINRQNRASVPLPESMRSALSDFVRQPGLAS